MISKKLLLGIATALILTACNDRVKLCNDMIAQDIFNQTALEHCKIAAEKGDAKAKVNYAKVLFQLGNQDDAQQILKKEADAKNLDAVLELMQIYSEEDDESLITGYLHQACDLGHKDSCDAINAIKEAEKALAEFERKEKQAEHDAKVEALRKEKAEFEAKKAREEANLERERQALAELEKARQQKEQQALAERYAEPQNYSSIDLSKLKFNEGMAYFKDEYSGLYGFVNSSGMVVIPAQFKNAGGIYNGRAVVQDHNELWGYIDKQGNWIIRPQYCMAGRFSEGLAGVYVGGYKQGTECYGGKWGFITPSGKMAIEPRFDKAWAFSKSGGKVKAKVELDQYTGYINGKGEWVD